MSFVDYAVISALSLALGLGLLIGLQRQHVGSEFGGIRTFPLIALLGAMCGLLSEKWGGIVMAGGLVGVAGTALGSNLRRSKDEPDRAGQTPEAAALVTFACGALLTTEYRPYAIAIAGLTAVLLHLKDFLHKFARNLSDRDIQAIMRFAVVSLIVLPLVPDTEFGPFKVLNPHRIWWMVVLIVGIGLAGYVSFRLFGQRAGGWLSGILGGLVSSTATTVAYARQVQSNFTNVGLATSVIMIASTVAALRVIVEVALVAPNILSKIAAPLCIFLALMILIALIMGRQNGEPAPATLKPGNPAELKSALLFGAIYAVITLGSATAHHYYGTGAIYGVAVISGVADVDAITLATANQAAAGLIESSTAWRVILVAFLTNLVFKSFLAGLLGSGKLFARLLIPTTIAVIGGAALMLFWNDG